MNEELTLEKQKRINAIKMVAGIRTITVLIGFILVFLLEASTLFFIFPLIWLVLSIISLILIFTSGIKSPTMQKGKLYNVIYIIIALGFYANYIFTMILDLLLW